MTQLTLTLEQGISVRHRSLRECMAAGVYQRGLTRVAGQIDMAPSKLSEKLSGGNGDRHRDVGRLHAARRTALLPHRLGGADEED